MSHATTIGNFTDVVMSASDDGGNSATLALGLGTTSWSGLKHNGREAGVYQARGATSVIRREARAYPTLTITAQLARTDDNFALITRGEIAGYVSTTADIGDYATFDLTIDRSYKTNSRISTFDDCYCDDITIDIPDGGPATVTLSVTVLGKVVMDGETVIASL